MTVAETAPKENSRTAYSTSSPNTRAKTAERTRRGKLKKVKEGKILAGNCADYGFIYNTARDGYVVDEEAMLVVRHVFCMVSVEGVSLRSVATTLNREGVNPPGAP
jgi:hypothetical protein